MVGLFWCFLTFFSLFTGAPQLLPELPSVSVSVFDKEISTVAVARDLDLYLDQGLSY